MFPKFTVDIYLAARIYNMNKTEYHNTVNE